MQLFFSQGCKCHISSGFSACSTWVLKKETAFDLFYFFFYSKKNANQSKSKHTKTKKKNSNKAPKTQTKPNKTPTPQNPTIPEMVDITLYASCDPFHIHSSPKSFSLNISLSIIRAKDSVEHEVSITYYLAAILNVISFHY